MKILTNCAWPLTVIFFFSAFGFAFLQNKLCDIPDCVIPGIVKISWIGFVIFFIAGCIAEIANCIIRRRINRAQITFV
ncbi:hypothetical protein BNJ_00268 [Kaumoebavirus]|uniref:hypothetical protein n=1 Tax=Kaumoebavirus TaxID=1859492 RepID=UPI0009C1CAEE|nr:hypothetical protein BNJ_00268 [Kaumoebavirus]ARA72092.1 hypothetical protein BNJ_00268 [Kaumoebavirus]